MDLRIDNSFSAAPDAVFAALTNQQVREQACVRGKALSHQVTVTGDPGGSAGTHGTHGRVVTVVREMPADRLPQVAKKFVGASMTVRQIETWGDPDAQGSRTAEVRGEVTGVPVSITGSTSIAPTGGGSRRTSDLRIKVNLPLVGRKIEPFVAQAVQAALEIERAVVAERVGG